MKGVVGYGRWIGTKIVGSVWARNRKKNRVSGRILLGWGDGEECGGMGGWTGTVIVCVRGGGGRNRKKNSVSGRILLVWSAGEVCGHAGCEWETEEVCL